MGRTPAVPPFVLGHECVAEVVAVGDAVRAVAPGGTCTSTGIYFLDTPLPLFDMYLKDVTSRTGRPSVGPHIAKVRSLLADGRIHPEKLSETAPWTMRSTSCRLAS